MLLQLDWITVNMPRFQFLSYWSQSKPVWRPMCDARPTDPWILSFDGLRRVLGEVSSDIWGSLEQWSLGCEFEWDRNRVLICRLLHFDIQDIHLTDLQCGSNFAGYSFGQPATAWWSWSRQGIGLFCLVTLRHPVSGAHSSSFVWIEVIVA